MRDYWREDYPDFADFSSQQIFIEPHSTKQIEDAIRWTNEFQQKDFEFWIVDEELQVDDGGRPVSMFPHTGVDYASRSICQTQAEAPLRWGTGAVLSRRFSARLKIVRVMKTPPITNRCATQT